MVTTDQQGKSDWGPTQQPVTALTGRTWTVFFLLSMF